MRLTINATTTGAGHPTTSVAAAFRALGTSGSGRRRVMQAIAEADDGLTDEELQVQLCMSPNTARPRRVELARFGLIEASDLRRPTMTGSPSIVWTPTVIGLIALACDPE